MIILFDEAEVEFNTLGLGVLNDVKSGVVTEGLNDIFEFKVEYPITGSNYSKLKIGRILFAKPNPYDSMQPFRIAAITKPIKGIVSILCYHISYDTNGIPCKAIKANSLSEALQLIKENSIVDNNFDLTTDVSFSRKFETTAPYNVRALLMGDEKESLIGVYNSEIKFNKFSIILMSKRGKNRGAKVTYGCNMTDLNHETTNERLFNGVFPYYHKEQESTETVSEDTFTKAYIVGSKPFQDGWLSFSKDGDPYHPVDSTPVQIATEGEYEEKVYSWNSIYQRYDEKIYNESITLIEGIIEPSWISIDWSKFPNVVCKANAKGYFKSSTDTAWGALKGVGDVIFEGNVLTSGLTNMASNMIIYYSEVLPPNRSSSSETTVTSVDVMLDDPIIWLSTTDAKTMKYNKILSLDLTSEFEEEPTKDKLKSKAEEYIVKNLVGTVKHTTTVSFIDLASTSEKEKYKNFDHIELGDTIQVSYKDLGVDVELRVISTEYDVIKDKYISIELGEKKNKFSGESVQNGDNISSLSNDVGYTDVTTVNKLIADTITADYLQAVNATMSKAQIEYLQVAKISCPGILEASQLVLDELVAKMLIADNAKISETLEAGTIKVAGDISITSGSINITDNDNTSFIVDREGNVTANSVSITGGTFNINDGMFEVTNDGTLYSKDAFVEGEIVATSGKIGNCTIDEEGILRVPGANINGTITAVNIVGGSINIGQIGSTSNYNFTVNEYGSVNANSLAINGGSIKIGDKFEVTNDGYLTATGADISGEVNINSGSISISGSEGTSFEVNESGNVTANSLNITGGSINIEGQNTSFSIDKNGNLEANSVTLTGGTIENLHITGSIYFRDSQAQIIEAYVRRNSITYKHNNVTMVTEWESDEVQRHVTLTINTSFEMVGRYSTLEGLGYDDVFDPESEPYDSETDPNITEFEVLDDDGHDYTGAFINYVCDDQPRVYLHNGDYEYTDRNFGFESDDDIIAYDKQSNWLSLTDYVPGQGDGPALTPATGVIYAVYEDGIFKDFYAWNGSSYAETSIPKYYINEDGVHLPGIDATVDQTIIGPFITTSNAMTTNKDKAGILDTESGLYMDSTGVGYYNSTTRQKVAISEDFGLYSTNISIDVLRRYSGYNPSQLTNASPGTKPIFAMLTSWIMPSSDTGIITTQTPSYPNQDSFLFMTYIGSNDIPIKINSNATRTVRYGGTGELYFARNVSLVNVYVSQLTTSNNTERNVTVSWSRYNTNYWDIVIKNTASSQIQVTLLLIFNYNYNQGN